MPQNADSDVVAGFGDEWTRFDQAELPSADRDAIAAAYFRIFPWSALPPNAVGFDLGCGSGRWAAVVAPRVGTLHCIDASRDALAVARRNLAGLPNVRLHQASVDAIPLADGSCDFGYSLGVLHHVPDTRAGIAAAVRKLKPGAPLLLYLYYAFDNRPWWFRRVWQASEAARFVVSRMPHGLRYAASQLLAAVVYLPLARLARGVEAVGADVSHFPLSAYRRRSFYVMRTDALDRFGTRLEQRFSRAQIAAMMEDAELRDVTFSDSTPYWCAVGFRAD
jgi:SAM-dependent methyltransferase